MTDCCAVNMCDKDFTMQQAFITRIGKMVSIPLCDEHYGIQDLINKVLSERS